MSELKTAQRISALPLQHSEESPVTQASCHGAVSLGDVADEKNVLGRGLD